MIAQFAAVREAAWRLAAGTISPSAIGCVLMRGRRRRSSGFGPADLSVAWSWRVRRRAGGRCLKGHPWASAARMRVQVQVRLVPLPETTLYKAI